MLVKADDENDPSRILVFVPNWVGDVAMATPALRAVRRRFDDARIVHLIRPYAAAVLDGTGFADETLFWPSRRGGSGGGYGSLIRRLRREKFDLALLFLNSFRSGWVALLSGAKRRVGYGRDGRSWLLTDRLIPKRAGGRYVPVPALDYYAELARYVSCDDIEDRLELATDEADEAAIDRRVGPAGESRPLVVLNPGANFGAAKCWPPEFYAALSDQLVNRFGARVVASTVPAEREIADRLATAAREPIEIFIDPPLGLGPLKALIRRADVLITNDTGPRHFAAAFDTPVVTVFGSSDPAWTDTRFAKERIVRLDLECQPCMKRVCPLKHHHCMRQLEPDMVFGAVEEILAARSASAKLPG